MTKEKIMEKVRAKLDKFKEKEEPGATFYHGQPLNIFTKKEIVDILTLIVYQTYSRKL